MAKLPLTLRLALFYVAIFAAIGIFMPFWPVWLHAQGLSATEIGVVLALGRWLSVVTSPMVANLADRTGERRRPILICAAGFFLTFLLYLPAQGFWQILAVAVLAALFLGPIGPLHESLTMASLGDRRAQYGRVRLWGSISFILAAMGAGALLDHRSPDVILWAMLGTLAAMVCIGFVLPDTRPPPSALKLSAIPRLATNRVYGPFLVSVAMLQCSHAMIYAFGTLHWRAAGIDDAVIGWLWAEGVIAEVLLFAFAPSVLRQWGPGRLMLLAAAAGLVRWPLLGFSTDLPVLVAVQALHAFTFGAAHLGSMAFIAEAAPPGLSATAQTLYNTLAMGFGFAVITPALGPVYEALGGHTYYLMAVLSVLGALAVLVVMRRWDGQPIRI
ncbi:MAG: 3-phenylpropionate MFS transporter [Alphaproteobacteria bacterium]